MISINMKIILLIIAVLYLINAIRVKNIYVNYYHGFNTSGLIGGGHFIGTFIACTCEGICWWYIISNILENFNK